MEHTPGRRFSEKTLGKIYGLINMLDLSNPGYWKAVGMGLW